MAKGEFTNLFKIAQITTIPS